MNVKQQPGPMPRDREEWLARLDLSNFINTYYQYRDISRLKKCGRILIVGPGQGLDTAVLKWRGYDVTTFDIDNTFHPDILGSIHDLSMIADQSYDFITASHVLEHLPVRYLDDCIKEMSRVAKYALVYLPVNGRHLQLRLRPGLRGWHWSWGFDLINWLRRPSGERLEFMSGQHYWEVGLTGFSKQRILQRMKKHFSVVDVYRNTDWTPSMNFVLKSKFAV